MNIITDTSRIIEQVQNSLSNNCYKYEFYKKYIPFLAKQYRFLPLQIFVLKFKTVIKTSFD